MNHHVLPLLTFANYPRFPFDSYLQYSKKEDGPIYAAKLWSILATQIAQICADCNYDVNRLRVSCLAETQLTEAQQKAFDTALRYRTVVYHHQSLYEKGFISYGNQKVRSVFTVEENMTTWNQDGNPSSNYMCVFEGMQSGSNFIKAVCYEFENMGKSMVEQWFEDYRGTSMIVISLQGGVFDFYKRSLLFQSHLVVVRSSLQFYCDKLSEIYVKNEEMKTKSDTEANTTLSGLDRNVLSTLLDLTN